MGPLSGGQRKLVGLACRLIAEPDLLLLDEPTNNLDIPSAEVLEAALEEFPGAVIVVSHDRHFLDRVADRIFELDDGELKVHEGSYSASHERKERAARERVERERRQQPRAPQPTPAPARINQQKRR